MSGSLCIELFSALVSWMVVTINENLHGERSMSASNMLSFLDMFGFENQVLDSTRVERDMVLDIGEQSGAAAD